MLPLLIGAGIGGLMGLVKSKQNEDKMERQDKFRKAALTYAPWTGMQDPGGLNLPTGLGAVLPGAALGAMTGGMFGGAEGAASNIGANAAEQSAQHAAYMGAPGMMGAAGAPTSGAWSAMMGAPAASAGSAGALGGSLSQEQLAMYLPYMMQMSSNQ